MILWKDPHRVHADFLHDPFDHRQRNAVRIRKAASREIIAQHVFSAPHMQHVQIKPADPADAHRQMRLIGDVVVFLSVSQFAKALLRLIEPVKAFQRAGIFRTSNPRR